MAALVRRGIDADARLGAEAPASSGAPEAAATAFPQVPSEAGPSEAEPSAVAQTPPQPQPVLSPAALAYRKGDVAALAALAAAAGDPDERLALEWAALRADPHPRFRRARRRSPRPIRPGRGEATCATGRKPIFSFIRLSASAVAEFFAAEPPQSSAGEARTRARRPQRAGPVDEAIRTRFASCGATAISTPGPKSAILREFGVVAVKSRPQASRRPAALRRELRRRLPRRRARRPRRNGARQARVAAARGPLSPALLKAVPSVAEKRSGSSVRARSRTRGARTAPTRRRCCSASRRRIARLSSVRTNGGPSGAWSRANCST